jgi:hypothetical protein
MPEIVQAEEFHGFQTSGNSRPARLTCRRTNGSRLDVFAKFRGGVRNGTFGLCVELLCADFARALGLAVPASFFLEVSPEFVRAAPREAYDLLHRSSGLNFASEALKSGFSVIPPEPRIPIALRRRAAEIFAFDVLIQNFDRKRDNPNLLWNRTNIFLIDHESALHPTYSSEEAPNLTSLALDNFYDHVLYSSLSSSDCSLNMLSNALGEITVGTLDGWFDAVPEEWRSDALLRVRRRFEWIIEHRSEVCILIQERIA